jgi:hypothetical protein
MKAQVNPNYWSCLPTAFAMAINKPVTWFIEQIGHPGAEEPYGVKGLKAGFHEQECIEVLQRMNLTCTPIELFPTISPYADRHDAKPIFFGMGESDNYARLLSHMEKDRGILTGVYKRPNKTPELIGHATAWDHMGKLIYDPIMGRSYPFTKCRDYRFHPRCFWKIQRVQNV